MRDICLISQDAGHLMKMRDCPSECGTVDTMVYMLRRLSQYWFQIGMYGCRPKQQYMKPTIIISCNPFRWEKPHGW